MIKLIVTTLHDRHAKNQLLVAQHGWYEGSNSVDMIEISNRLNNNISLKQKRNISKAYTLKEDCFTGTGLMLSLPPDLLLLYISFVLICHFLNHVNLLQAVN
jgi:hypothetical protein